MNPTTVTSVGVMLHTVFGGFAGIMQSGALSLFYVSVIVSIGFILFAIGRAMMQGGGAVFETIAFRIFIIVALTLFVTGFQAFGPVIRADISNYAARLAGTNPYAGGEDFTPAGILQTNDKLADGVTASGKTLSAKILNAINPMKWATIIGVQIGSALLAFDLLLANVAMDVVFGCCAFLVGLILNPWLSSFTTDFFRLIVSTGVFTIMIGAFAAIGQSLAGIELGTVTAINGAAIPQNDMATMAVTSLVYAVIATIVPFAVAGRIGGGPIANLGAVLSAVRSGKASVGL
jgi:hypothetical protein